MDSGVVFDASGVAGWALMDPDLLLIIGGFIVGIGLVVGWYFQIDGITVDGRDLFNGGCGRCLDVDGRYCVVVDGGGKTGRYSPSGVPGGR